MDSSAQAPGSAGTTIKADRGYSSARQSGMAPTLAAVVGLPADTPLPEPPWELAQRRQAGRQAGAAAG